jgi:4-aminobutyrate aminotransferase / (S)-3-amino-2-methylpropionate transaminase / 5-aminovalerate transaminase
MQWPPASGNQTPLVDRPRTQSALIAERALAVNAPMGSMRGPQAPDLVYERAFGSNVFDADGNRYVDLAAGFGAILLGHCHPELATVIAEQSLRLTQALGDVFPSTEKIALGEQLAQRFGGRCCRVILGQSGADAVTAAVKTAMLATGRAGVIAFSGAYHGLSYAPLALCQLRESYRSPFTAQLNPSVRVVTYPSSVEQGERSLAEMEIHLSSGEVGAVVIEPILGRGGCIVPPDGFLSQLVRLTQRHGAVSIFDEIWTGLGRCGSLSYAKTLGLSPDILCLGKGLGGGLPMSACIGKTEVMQAWQRDEEVVHTSTFAGAPLAAAAACRLLSILDRDKLVERSLAIGDAWIGWLRERLSHLPTVKEVRGRGLMVGIDLGPHPGVAAKVVKSLLTRGWIGSTGGGTREVLILTPPLTIAESLLKLAADALYETLSEV